MKIITSFLTVLALTLVISCIPVYAADISSATPVSADDENSIVARGAISGYGQIWHEPSVNRFSGSTTFYVSGTGWPNAQLSVKLENFDPSTKMNIRITRGTTTIFYRENVGINDGPWENIKFSPGSTGAYGISYEIKSNNSAGRINCWIF